MRPHRPRFAAGGGGVRVLHATVRLLGFAGVEQAVLGDVCKAHVIQRDDHVGGVARVEAMVLELVHVHRVPVREFVNRQEVEDGVALV